MKTKFLIALSCFLILADCSDNNSNEENSNLVVKTLWNLIEVTGASAGMDNKFELGQIIWTYHPNGSELTVVNNNEDANLEDGPDSGVYSFSILNIDGDFFDDQSFFIINGIEFGYFYYPNDYSLVIDQNIKSIGEELYGEFIYKFERTNVIE